MKNQDYEPQNTHRPAGGPPGGRRAHSGEKAKDLIGTWKKLLRYCKKYGAALAIAILCAIAGTVLTLIGPDKLSEMTELITQGIMKGIDMNAVVMMICALI